MRSRCLLLSLALAGCLRTGAGGTATDPCPGGNACCALGIDCPSDGAPPAPSDAGAETSAPLPTAADQPGRAPFRLLSSLELRNTLRDLVGQVPAAVATYPPDYATDDGSDFRWGAGITTTLTAVAIADIAAAAAAQLDLATLIPCQPVPADAAAQESCAATFITGFGLRAFRRPLDGAEAAALLALYRAGRSADGGLDFAGGLRLVVEAMLQSPFFLYRWEVTPPLVRDGALVRFGPYEMASRLSYGLWATMPDATLFAAAAAGQLDTPAALEQQARRMLADARAQPMVLDFFSQALDTQDLAGQQKDAPLVFTPDIARSMQAEMQAFTADLMLGPAARGTLADLLTSPTTFVDANLARIYGVPAPAAGLARVTLDGGQRAGILTQLAFLAANANERESSIVRRGVVLYQHVLCQQIPAPPASVEVTLVEPPPNATQRERYEAAIANGCTGGCHPIYPLGFAFENYDAIGAFRTVDPSVNRPLDASGSLSLPSGQLEWTSAVDLAHLLPSFPDARDCAGKQWFRYLMRRSEGPGDALSLALASESFIRTSGNLQELVVALVRTRAFSHRTPADGEVLP